MLMLKYVINEKILYKESCTSRTRKAYTVIHCNLSPQSISGLYAPPKGDTAVLNTVNTFIVLILPPVLFLCFMALFLPWIMHGLVACNIKIEVCGVLHLIGVPSGLNPVSYWETINTIHQVVFIISTATVMVRSIAWNKKKWQTEQLNQCFA